MIAFLSSLALLYPNYTFHDTDVFAKSLVVENVTPSSILDHFDQCSNSRVSRYSSKKAEVLTFITPWHSIGYNLTLDFGFKFTTVVPVWFQVLSDKGLKFGGEQDILPDWLNEMRSVYPKTKILPRVNFEIPVATFVKSANEIGKFLRQKLGGLSERYKFEGFFLEFQAYFGSVDALRVIPSVVAEIRKGLQRKALLFADIRWSYSQPYSGVHLKAVQSVLKSLDGGFVALYELGVPSLSPIEALDALERWSREQKVMQSVIVGLPFFGFHFTQTSADHIVASDVKAVLEAKKPKVQWMKSWREHGIFFTEARSQHQVWYPTLLFLHDRFEAVVARGFRGFGFWELAQGMPYFFDLL
jgi:chitinase domain-containing protein 1